VGLALIISAGWLAAAIMFWLGGGRAMAVVSIAAAIVPIVLTHYLRRLAGAQAARVYLREQQARGVSPAEARERVHELAPDGVTFDTDDVPNWPVYTIMLFGLGAVIAAVVAIVDLLS
jgi:hypothetical protein